MRREFADEHLDLLQNIESGVVRVYDERPDLIDYDVEEAYDALIRRYKALDRDRTPPEPSMTEKPQAVYDAVKPICDWRRGKSREIAWLPDTPAGTERSPAKLVSCLRELKKSLEGWRKRGGRQGYLNFIEQYV